MSVIKKYSKKKDLCKVTFTLPAKLAKSAKTAYVVGEFNGWDMHRSQMKKDKEGAFTATIEMIAGKEYQFRYLINDSTWGNEPEADKHVVSPYGDSENSVVTV
jgi:1,4-alpha-glucan branching enzyme